MGAGRTGTRGFAAKTDAVILSPQGEGFLYFISREGCNIGCKRASPQSWVPPLRPGVPWISARVLCGEIWDENKEGESGSTGICHPGSRRFAGAGRTGTPRFAAKTAAVILSPQGEGSLYFTSREGCKLGGRGLRRKAGCPTPSRRAVYICPRSLRGDLGRKQRGRERQYRDLPSAGAASRVLAARHTPLRRQNRRRHPEPAGRRIPVFHIKKTGELPVSPWNRAHRQAGVPSKLCLLARKRAKRDRLRENAPKQQARR